MPMYTYQVVTEDGSEGEIFEVIRTMSDPPLTEHPDTGEPVTRIFQPVHIAGITNAIHAKSRMDDKKLDNLGFTKYQKNGKGHYERTAGSQGPSEIHSE